MTDTPIRPVFVDRKTAASWLMISVDTFNLWLQAGFIPKPVIDRGQIVRWHWPSVEAKLADVAEPHHDPSVEGVKNVWHPSQGRRPRAKNKPKTPLKPEPSEAE